MPRAPIERTPAPYVPEGRGTEGGQPRKAAASAASPHDAAAFDLDRHLFFWFTQVIGRRDRLLVAELKPFGLRVPEWRVLAGLRGRQRCSMGELADIANFDQTTLSRTVDRLVEAGWVLRLADADDMRVTRLALTPEGHALFEEIWPIVDRLNEAAVADLPGGAVELMCAAMRVMRGSLDQCLDAEKDKTASREPRGAA